MNQQTIKDYLALGWYLIPIESVSLVGGRKTPKFLNNTWKEWQTRRPSEQEVEVWSKKCTALGLIPNKKLVVIDIDNTAVLQKYPYLKSNTYVDTLSGGRHLYFAYDERLDELPISHDFRNSTGDEIEYYAGNNHYVFLPPSEVEGEVAYTFGAQDLTNLQPVPDEFILYLVESVSEWRSEGGGTNIDESGNLVLPELFEGSRDNAFISLAGSTYRLAPPKIWNLVDLALKEYNQTKVHPPLDGRSLDRIRKQGRLYASSFWEERLPEQLIQKDFTTLVREQLSTPDRLFTTGYTHIDEQIKGLAYANTYIVGGMQKSGKSSFLMKMLHLKIKEGVKIGFINTELSASDFVRRMCCYEFSKPYEFVTKDDIFSWVDKYGKSFEYLGIENIQTVEGVKETTQEFVAKGVECLVFDNLTSFGAKVSADVDGWQVQGDLLDFVVRLSKKHNIISFPVLHSKQAQDKNSGLKIPKDALSIFEDTTTIKTIPRPTISTLYGGGTALSQVSGSILVWRPYMQLHDDRREWSEIRFSGMRHMEDMPFFMSFDGSRYEFVTKQERVWNVSHYTDD